MLFNFHFIHFSSFHRFNSIDWAAAVKALIEWGEKKREKEECAADGELNVSEKCLAVADNVLLDKWSR